MIVADRVCVVSGCETNTRHNAEYCEMHKARLYRTGSVTLAPKVVSPNISSTGYLRFGSTFVHRFIFDLNNPGDEHACWRCGVGMRRKEIHVDHVDGNRMNNSPGNLKAACMKCNISRPEVVAKMAAAKSHYLTFKGETKTLKEWADGLGISRQSLRIRLANWSLGDALTTPRGKTGPRRQTS